MGMGMGLFMALQARLVDSLFLLSPRSFSHMGKSCFFFLFVVFCVFCVFCGGGGKVAWCGVRILGETGD